MNQEIPKPLIQSNVDLRDFEFMPLDVVRLRDSDFAALANAESFRAGMLLIASSWHQVPAGSLPGDDRVLSNLAGFGRVVKEWKKYKDEALHGWVLCDDGRYYHPVVCEKASESWSSKQEYNYKKFAERLRKLNIKRNGQGLSEISTPTINEWIDAGKPESWQEDSTNNPTEFQPPSNNIPTEGQGNSNHLPPENQKPSSGIPTENALKGTEHKGQVRDIDINIGETSSPDDVSQPPSPPDQKRQSKPKPEKYNPILVDLPDNVNREAWEGYVSMRVSIKKPLTERATTLVLNKLTEFGKFADIALDNSTVNNWQDVFMPKDETKPIGLPKSRSSPAGQPYQPRFSNQNQQRDNTVIQGEYRDV